MRDSLRMMSIMVMEGTSTLMETITLVIGLMASVVAGENWLIGMAKFMKVCGSTANLLVIFDLFCYYYEFK
jgi:hypothetical protein